MDDLIHRLRAWADAYPADIFAPLTDEEKSALPPGTIDRCAAAMGRHMSTTLIEIAGTLEDQNKALLNAKECAEDRWHQIVDRDRRLITAAAAMQAAYALLLGALQGGREEEVMGQLVDALREVVGEENLKVFLKGLKK